MKLLNLEWGLGFKLNVFIFVSVGIIFYVIFLYNYDVSKKIVEKNLKTNAENLTTATVLRIDKVLSSVQKIPDNFAKDHRLFELFGGRDNEDITH